MQTLKGIKDIDRVAGPDFMKEIFRKTSGTGLRHFFLGDTGEILEKLINKIGENYDLQIAGRNLSPEFGNWTAETDEQIIKESMTLKLILSG
ncbi:MAG: WecB/TagA/CpsF family glycosyltransferase [Ignavibacteria bacterium]